MRHFLILALLLTSGCSTIMEGKSQQITVKSSPTGAQCVFKQADDVVARVTTPGSATVDKMKNDLVILCSKEGYESATVKNRSDLALSSLGNMALYQLSFVGNAVDSMSGANNKYDSDVFVTLARAETPTSFPAPPGAPPVIKLAPETAARMSMQVPMPGMGAPPSSPVAAANAPTFVSATGPANYAAMAMGKTAHAFSAAANQPMPLTYAQETAEATRRPPFEITQ